MLEKYNGKTVLPNALDIDQRPIQKIPEEDSEWLANDKLAEYDETGILGPKFVPVEKTPEEIEEEEMTETLTLASKDDKNKTKGNKGKAGKKTISTKKSKSKK
jgi:hypothetical protein